MGFAYAMAGVGLWMLGAHVFSGGAWEQRTPIAMSLRTLAWAGIATLAWRAVVSKNR